MPMRNGLTLVVHVVGHPKPLMLEDVTAGGIPPNQIHVRLSRAQLIAFAKAAAEELAGEKAVNMAGKFVGAALDELFTRKVKRGRLR